MSEPRQPLDDLELKKRARRRLVGAVAFALFAAVVLPMVMDEAPPPAGHDIELRIPGQDQVTSSPLATGKAAPLPSSGTAKPIAPEPPAAGKPASGAATEAVVPATVPPAPTAIASSARVAEAALPAKPAGSTSEGKEAARTAVAPASKSEPVAKKEVSADARRAQAILDAQGATAMPSVTEANGAQVILIGAFANATNVKNLQIKLGQLGIKTYTENLESPQGRKTRVRAGPFANREAAEKALEKMKRIGVAGVVAPKS